MGLELAWDGCGQAAPGPRDGKGGLCGHLVSPCMSRISVACGCVPSQLGEGSPPGLVLLADTVAPEAWRVGSWFRGSLPPQWGARDSSSGQHSFLLLTEAS